MKKITYIFLSFAFLASCTNLSALSTTPTPQATSTLTATFTPTITPTITSTPTETPDPNKPSDATGKDPSTGDYIKTVEENGKTVDYVWKQFQFGDDSKNGIAGHWFKSWMANGAINLTPLSERCIYPNNNIAINMDVYAIEGQTDLEKIGTIFHPNRGAEIKDIKCGSSSLSETILFDLFLRYINIFPSNSNENEYKRFMDYYYPDGKITDDGKQKASNDQQEFLKLLDSQKIVIKVENCDWIPQKGYEVYWINEDMVMNDPTFQVNISASVLKSYYLKVMAKDGKLIAFIAPGKGWLKGQLVRPKDSRERIFKTMILFPLEAAIKSTYPIENASFLPFQDYQGMAGIISGTINGKSIYIDIPFIDFTPLQ